MGDSRIDWRAAEESPEFKELVTRRRRFVVPATIFFLAWYLGFILLAGYAPDFMGESVYEGLTVGYVLALSQFAMTWILGWMYLRRADRIFDPLAARAARRARHEADEQAAAAPGPRRFVRREMEPGPRVRAGRPPARRTRRARDRAARG